MNEPGPNDGRLMLSVGGLLFIPLCVGGVYSLAVVLPAPQGPIEWGFRVLFEELAITATLFFTIGFAWGITGSRRLKRMLDVITVKFAWIFIPIAVAALATAAWVAIFMA
jgi:hypothetical protein